LANSPSGSTTTLTITSTANLPPPAKRQDPADSVSPVGGHDGARQSYGDLLRGVPANRAVPWAHGLSHVGVNRDYFGRPHGLRWGSLHLVHSGSAVGEHYRHGNVGRNFENGNAQLQREIVDSREGTAVAVPRPAI
jgi:hypothetical protein